MSGIWKPTVGTQLNVDHPLSQGLVLCALMNENSGKTVHDYSGQWNEGTISGMNDPPIAASGWNAGPYGGALAFDGNNDYVDVPYAPSLKLGDNGTIALLFDFISLPAGTHNFMSYGGNLYALGYLISQSGADLSIYWKAPGANMFVNNILQTGVLQHVVVTNNNGNLALYYNGKIVTTGVSGGTIIETYPTYIGGHNTDWYTNSLISSISIYNRALSAQEIAYLYAFPYCMFEQVDLWIEHIPIAEVLCKFTAEHIDYSFVAEYT